MTLSKTRETTKEKQGDKQKKVEYSLILKIPAILFILGFIFTKLNFPPLGAFVGSVSFTLLYISLHL